MGQCGCSIRERPPKARRADEHSEKEPHQNCWNDRRDEGSLPFPNIRPIITNMNSISLLGRHLLRAGMKEQPHGRLLAQHPPCLVRNLVVVPSSRPEGIPAAVAALPPSFARREIHFLPLLGLWGVKHISAWALYNACKNYGWARVYRRLLEQNRILISPTTRQSTQQAIRLAIQAPPQFATQVATHAQVLQPFLEGLAQRAQPAVPSFLVAAAKFVVNSQKPVKVILQDMMNVKM